MASTLQYDTTMDTMKANTMTRAMHTVTFEAANGYQEVCHFWSWDDFHRACQMMERNGLRVAMWVDRSN